ncbi:MAG: DUF3391 domain-containing protein [Nitrospinae bacterium]|nr:DUF3391 domain-containing protein [Nitrospinota bacterium]
MYIKLVGNWFAHPFSKSSFKIKDEKDLATLHALRNYKILYDPERSDPLPSSEMENDSCEDVQTSLDPSSPPIEENHQKEISPYINSPEKRQANQARLEKLKEAEKEYQEVLKQNKESIHEVKAGYAKGVRKAENLVNTLGEILDQNGALVSLMNFIGNKETSDDFNYHSLNVCMLSMVLGQGLDLPQDVRHRGTLS